jgi:hypothetical protein
MKTLAEVLGPNSSIKKITEALDKLEVGLLASVHELAQLSGVAVESIKSRHGQNPALAAYRFHQGNGRPSLWGNRKTIEKLLEGRDQ